MSLFTGCLPGIRFPQLFVLTGIVSAVWQINCWRLFYTDITFIYIARKKHGVITDVNDQFSDYNYSLRQSHIEDAQRTHRKW